MAPKIATTECAPELGEDEIRSQVKLAIAKVSGTDVSTIPDEASFRDELGLDSLSIIELVVEVQYRFRIPDLPDEQSLSALETIGQTVDLVRHHLLMA